MRDESPHRPLRFTEVKDLQRRRQQKLKLIILLFGILILLGCVYFLISLVTVRKVNCSLEGGSCSSDLIQLSKTLLGRSMFSELQLSHPYMENTVARSWPNAVNVKFKQPKILVSLQSTIKNSVSYSLTDSGYIVSNIEPEELVIEDLELEKLSIGSKVSGSVLDFYKMLIPTLKTFKDTPISSVKIVSEDEILIYLGQNITAIAMRDGIKTQLSSLQAILLSPTIDKVGKTIDLRFENPVLK